jgi:hypothetical protein
MEPGRKAAMKRVEPWQAKKIGAMVGPMLRYLFRLKKRMAEVGYSESHPLHARVLAAYEAIRSLNEELDLTAVGKGNGRPPAAMG